MSKKRNKPILNDMIADDRLDVQKLAQEIAAMTDEEFEEYLQKVKKEKE